MVVLCVRKAQGRGRGLGQNPKPNRRGLVSCAPCKTAAGDGGKGQWGDVVVVLVVVCPSDWKYKGRGGGLAQNPQNRARRLDFGRAVGNGGGERWGEVVGGCGRGGGGGVVLRLTKRGRGGVWGPKTRN